MLYHDAATERAAGLLIDAKPSPDSRLDAFLLLASEEHLWRTAGPGADFADTKPRPAGRFLGCLASQSRGRSDAGDWRAEERLLVGVGIARETARIEPPCMLLDAELRVIELARVHVVEPGAGA